MPLTNAERQRAWRERHQGKPRGNKAMAGATGSAAGARGTVGVGDIDYAIGQSQGTGRTDAGGVSGAEAALRPGRPGRSTIRY